MLLQKLFGWRDYLFPQEISFSLKPLPLNAVYLRQRFYDHFYNCFVQLRPQVSSVSEDGRQYELVVESTVPVPCLEESSSSTELCTLSLQLSTSSKGEDWQQDNDRLPPTIFLFSVFIIMQINRTSFLVVLQVMVCWVQICLCPPVWWICPGAPVRTGFVAELWSTSAPSQTLSKMATGRLRSLLNQSSRRIFSGADTHQNLLR